jgi:trehalose synthase
MWKSRSVIGGDTGGIRLQAINHHTGFLVNCPQGAALYIRCLLHYKDRMLEMGRKARQFVLEYFLPTRHLREYPTMMAVLTRSDSDRIEIPF